MLPLPLRKANSIGANSHPLFLCCFCLWTTHGLPHQPRVILAVPPFLRLDFLEPRLAHSTMRNVRPVVSTCTVKRIRLGLGSNSNARAWVVTSCDWWCSIAQYRRHVGSTQLAVAESCVRVRRGYRLAAAAEGWIIHKRCSHRQNACHLAQHLFYSLLVVCCLAFIGRGRKALLLSFRRVALDWPHRTICLWGTTAFRDNKY